MKKRIIASFGWWLCMFLLFVGSAFLTESTFAVAGMIIWLLLPAVTWGINLGIKKSVSLKLEVTPTACKGEKKQVTLLLHNQSRWAVGKLICELEFQNTLTGEKQIHIADVPVKAKGTSKLPLFMTSKHCGYVRMRVTKAFLMDWFSFLPVQCSFEVKRKVDILPDIFQTHISLQIPEVSTVEAEEWSLQQRGEDYGEVFCLREYAEGDSLKQIHWKLASKTNTLIVKEGSLPIKKTCLLFWDKGVKRAKPEEMDAMAEVVASISQAVMELGNPFTLGWTEAGGAVFEEIQSEEDFIQVLPRMLKEGCGQTERNSLTEKLEEKGSYGKILYFAKEIPEYMEEVKNVDIRYILCTKEQSQENVYAFTSATYLQDMAVLEL